MVADERLRVLQVIHQFPPHSSQGSEVYCDNLAREMAAGAEVAVFHVSDPGPGWRRELRRERRHGLSIYHCVDRGHYARLAERDNAFLRRCVVEAVAEFRPAVVHFHNYLSLGDPLVSLARAGGAKVVYTLHDYGLICPRVLLQRDDGALCDKMRPDFFQDCCPQPIRRLDRFAGDALARLPSLERWQLFARGRGWRSIESALAAARRRWGAPPEGDLAGKRDFFFAQTRRIFADTDLFLAPSRFLLERFVSCGLPADKIVFSPYGMRHFSARRTPRGEGPVRFGYIGALHPQKGIGLLVEAFRGLGHARLDVHGSTFGSPISNGFAAELRRAAGPEVFFHGGYDNERVGDVLAAIDVLVVPSVWYENAPLTIREAFIAGVPVLTADRGGMAELAGSGGGLLFRLGDARDLRAKMQAIVERPALLDELRGGIPPVQTIEEDARLTLDRYRALLRPAVGSG